MSRTNHPNLSRNYCAFQRLTAKFADVLFQELTLLISGKIAAKAHDWSHLAQTYAPASSYWSLATSSNAKVYFIKTRIEPCVGGHFARTIFPRVFQISIFVRSSSRSLPPRDFSFRTLEALVYSLALGL